MNVRSPIPLIVIVALTAWPGGLAPGAAAQEWEVLRPDAHAPIGVEANRMVEARRFLVGVHSEYLRYGELRREGQSATATEVFALGYTESPTWMNAHHHRLTAKYGVTDAATVFLELPYGARTMEIERAGTSDGTRSVRGPGDVRLGGIARLLERGAMVAQADLTVNLPTGRVEAEEDGSLVYGLQPAAGSLGLLPGVTVMGQRPLWSWGARAGGGVWLGESAEGHRPGNGVVATAWLSRRFTTWGNAALRVQGEAWGDVRHDVATQPANPAAEPAFTDVRRVEVLASGNLFAAAGLFLGHRLYGEIGMPVWEERGGPGLARSWRGSVGWSWRVP